MDIDLSWDPARLQFDRIHTALAASYWSPRIRRDIVERAAANSLTVGAYDRATGEQVAYARVITDRATYAYLCDVIVFDPFRGQGIGKAIVEAAVTHPDLATIRNFTLGTRDAHSLYERFGFGPVADCSRRMEKRGRDESWKQ
jgi:GNAT superfamily N-acetyltransferase